MLLVVARPRLPNSKSVYKVQDKIELAQQIISDKDVFKSDNRCCAERNMIDHYVVNARKNGVPSHRLISHVRKKIGNNINILRMDSTAEPRCSFPCIFCRKVLEKFDITVTCIDKNGSVFVGKMTDDNIQDSSFTSGQKRCMKLI